MFWSLETREALEFTAGGRDYQIPAAAAVPDAELVPAMRSTLAFARWADVPAGYTHAVVEELRVRYCQSQGLPHEPGAIDELVSILNEYGEQLEIDIQRHDRLSVVELWQTRQWRRLRNHIDRLPPDTYYRQAILNDPELVEKMLAREKDEPKQNGIPVSQYTTMVSLQRDTITALKSLRATLIAVNSPGGKMPQVEPYPGPITAVEQANHRMRQQKHESLVARVLPDKKR